MHEINESNCIDKVNEFIETGLSEFPVERFSGNGIVIAAGGMKYNTNAYICIRMLRKLGCGLPIECWHLGGNEKDESFIEIIKEYGVESIDASIVKKKYHHERLFGWELKPYCITHSKFKNVLFLDADNVPIINPEFLFESNEFLENKAVFWPDYNKLEKHRECWKIFGNVEYREEQEFESGQILIDKESCWNCLELCNWYMQNSNNFYFKYVHGDKEVFHFSWMKLNKPYHLIKKQIETIPGTMCQHDFVGRRLFQHRNMKKWNIGINETIPGFTYENECIAFIAELQKQWNPVSKVMNSELDINLSSILTGMRFKYNRIGYDERVIELGKNGIISYGTAGMETVWWCENGRIIIASKDRTPSMRLHHVGYNIWVGEWLFHEKMPIALIPLEKPQQNFLKESKYIFSSGFFVRSDNVSQDNDIISDIYINDSYKMKEISKKHSSGNQFVVDIGAHIGTFAKLYREINPSASIVCIEVCKENFEALVKNIETFACAINAACTYEKDVCLLNSVYPACENTGGSIVAKNQIETISNKYRKEKIDNIITIEQILFKFNRKKIDILKLDCEGSEFSILPNIDVNNVGMIVGEYHNEKMFNELRRKIFSSWPYALIHSCGDLGTFHLRNPEWTGCWEP